MTPWSTWASAVEPVDKTFAPAAASIGAATLSWAAAARSIGDAASMKTSTSTLRSRIDTTSLSGSAVATLRHQFLGGQSLVTHFSLLVVGPGFASRVTPLTVSD